MPLLMILASDADEYRRRIEAENLPGLQLTVRPEEAEIVLGEPRKIREALPQLSRIKWAQAIYAGVESLMDSELRRDYMLTNARGVFGKLMSEYVFGYLLLHEKRMLERIEAQHARRWDRSESGVLAGRTLGLLGVGSIGAHLAGTAKHFGMTVHGFTRRSEDSPDVDVYFHEPDILEFAKGLDYLVCVLPRTPDTNRIVDAHLLDALPGHAIFVNVGRGNAVDESALVTALNEARISAAVLDVTAEEPLPADHPFWRTPGLLLTFHTSAISYPDDIFELFVENYRLYVEGKPLKHKVSFDQGY